MDKKYFLKEMNEIRLVQCKHCNAFWWYGEASFDDVYFFEAEGKHPETAKRIDSTHHPVHESDMDITEMRVNICKCGHVLQILIFEELTPGHGNFEEFFVREVPTPN